MKRLVSQIQLNSVSAQQRRLPNTVILRYNVYRSPFTCFERFLPLKLGQKVVLATRWCHTQFLKSSMLMFFVWRVRLKSYSIFLAVRNLAVNFPLKQTFVILTHAMTPSLSFYYFALCTLPRCAF